MTQSSATRRSSPFDERARRRARAGYADRRTSRFLHEGFPDRSTPLRAPRRSCVLTAQPGFREMTMNLLHVLLDGALAAAELLALLFVPPAAAAPPAALERSVALHRLSTAVDVRLLGTLADVRITQHLINDSSALADLAPHLPAVDDRADSLRVVRGSHAVELLGAGGCADLPRPGRVELSSDEAIADALTVAPGAAAIVEVARAAPLVRSGPAFRVALPARHAAWTGASAPIASLVEQDDAWFLVLVPDRPAHAASLVLRPAARPSQTHALGAGDTDSAIVVPLADRRQLDALAAGAIELELATGDATVWTTVAAQRIDARGETQARVAE
jgi:hypothetical protein